MAPDQVPEGQPATVVRIDLALMLQLHSLREQLAAAEAREAKLRKALEPFAKYGDTLPKDARNKWPMNDAGSREGRGPIPTVGDCRRARDAIAPVAGGQTR